MPVRIALAVSLALIMIGCGQDEKIDPAIEQLGRATGPVGPMPNKPTQEPAGSGTVHRGEIAETMNVPMYTYILVKSSSGTETWAAIPQTKVTVGQQVEVIESVVMRDFHSRTLSRTFPAIVFGTLKGQENASPHGMGAMPSGMGMPAPAAKGALPAGHPPIPKGDAGPSKP